MKIKNINTNVVFNLPKAEAENLMNEYPNLYKKNTKSKNSNKEQISQIKPTFEQNTILPLIWEE